MPPLHGLTLGKFAPLHKGHQYLIETALTEVDTLTVIIYDCPETTNIPLPVRSAWIRTLYPTVQVIEAWDGPLEVGDTPAIKRMHEDYITHILKIRGITHFYSSEFYGAHMSYALGAVDRRIDSARVHIPVSGTLARADPFAYRALIHPLVYRDLISNIVFLGAPSTGKTTIAEHMAHTFDTVWMPEYGREYWEQHQVDRRLTLEQLIEIAEGHIEREERLLVQANQYLFTDTNPITTAMFSHYYHGSVAPRLAELAREAAVRYDLVFVCDTDIPYDDTWDRSGEVNRNVFQKQILADLRIRKTPFLMLRGSIKDRVTTVQRVLNNYVKYSNLIEQTANYRSDV